MKKLFKVQVRIKDKLTIRYYGILCENEKEYQDVHTFRRSYIKECNRVGGIAKNSSVAMVVMSKEQELSLTFNGKVNIKGFGFAFRSSKVGLVETTFYFKESDRKDVVEGKIMTVNHNYLNKEFI